VTAIKVKEDKRHIDLSRGSDSQESYVLVEELTKSQVSLNHFLSQVIIKTDLELFTITNMGNTKFSRLTTQNGSSRAAYNHLGAQLQE
jgi:hypothetical protein